MCNVVRVVWWENGREGVIGLDSFTHSVWPLILYVGQPGLEFTEVLLPQLP